MRRLLNSVKNGQFKMVSALKSVDLKFYKKETHKANFLCIVGIGTVTALNFLDFPSLERRV